MHQRHDYKMDTVRVNTEMLVPTYLYTPRYVPVRLFVDSKTRLIFVQNSALKKQQKCVMCYIHQMKNEHTLSGPK